MSALLTDQERIRLLMELEPDKARTIGIVVELTLAQPGNRLSDSCRQLLNTPYDERLHPYVQEMLDFCEQAEKDAEHD